MTSDFLLLQKIRNGNNHAGNQFVEKYYSFIYQYFLSISCILIWTLIVSTDSIYQKISVPIWVGLLIISFGYLIFCVHKSQCNCEINWEVKSSGTAI